MEKTILISSLIILTFSMEEIYAQQINPSIAGETTSDSPDRVFIYGTGGTDALELSKITASGGLTVGIKFSDKFNGLIAYNFSGDVAKKEIADSIPLSTLYFPDIGSSAFYSKLDYCFSKNPDAYDEKLKILLGVEGSLQKRNIAKDTVVYDLSVRNIDGGLRFKWSHKKNDNNLTLRISFLWNHIEVSQISRDNFNALFSSTNSSTPPPPKIFNGFSAVAELDLNNAILYFRTYTDFKTYGDLIYTIGIKATGKFISF